MEKQVRTSAHRGSFFSEFLTEENLMPEVEILALKRVVALQLQQILDPPSPSLTMASLGRKVEL